MNESFKFTPTRLDGVFTVEPNVHVDARGYFMETYNLREFCFGGIRTMFVQDNQSLTLRGALRGLHFQRSKPQAKLVRVLWGEVFDVAVDLRRGSPTFAKWVGVTLSAKNKLQLYIPEGFAHGFLAISSEALLAYKCNEYYHPELDAGVRYDDPDIGIHWPFEDASTSPVLSNKDAALPCLREIADSI